MLARELDLPLGRVSYHIRLLADLGAIELVRTEPRRGALEHFYRAVTTVWFSEADWQKLPRSARRGSSARTSSTSSPASPPPPTAAASTRASVVLRAPLELDEEGLNELSELLRDSIERAREINLRAAERRANGARRPLHRARDPALRAPRVSSPAHGGSSTRVRRDRGGAGTGRRVDRGARAATDPRRVRHDDHRCGRDRRRLRARARARVLPARRLPRGPAGMFVFAAASLACAVARSLWLLLVFRAVQAAGAAAALLTAFEVLRRGRARAAAVDRRLADRHGGRPGARRRAHRALRLARDLRRARSRSRSPPRSRPSRPAGARRARAPLRRPDRRSPPLALTAAAFTAVLFLLVIELVAGFAISPIRAALGVSILPLAALAAPRSPARRGRGRSRARCCSPAAPPRSRSCPRRRSRGRSCRRCSPAPAWASRCPHSPPSATCQRRRATSSPATSASCSCSRSSRRSPPPASRTRPTARSCRAPRSCSTRRSTR